MPAGEDGRCAGAGDALSIRCRVFNRVQEGWPDLIIGCGVSGATPVYLNRCNIAIMFEDERLQSVGHRVCRVEDIEEPAADGGGQDVVLVAAGAGADSSQGQEHRQRRTHAEKVFHLKFEGWRR